jgi:CheY-like chemotaxis protein
VLMDIRLAGEMDGIEAALALRAQGIGSIFASANSDAGTLARGEAAQPLGW